MSDEYFALRTSICFSFSSSRKNEKNLNPVSSDPTPPTFCLLVRDEGVKTFVLTSFSLPFFPKQKRRSGDNRLQSVHHQENLFVSVCLSWRRLDEKERTYKSQDSLSRDAKKFPPSTDETFIVSENQFCSKKSDDDDQWQLSLCLTSLDYQNERKKKITRSREAGVTREWLLVLFPFFLTIDCVTRLWLDCHSTFRQERLEVIDCCSHYLPCLSFVLCITSSV